MKKVYMLLICSWLIMACKKQVPIHFPEEASRPVLSLLMEKDSILVARLTRSARAVFANKFPQITDATIQLYEDGQFRENLTMFEKYEYVFYKSTVKVKAGSTYRLVAKIPGYGDLEGSDYIPAPVNVGELSVNPIPGSKGHQSGEIKARISVQIHDKGGERNYYRIRIYIPYYYKDPDGTLYTEKYPTSFTTGNPQDTWFDAKQRDQFFIEDALFDGGSPRFNLVIDRWNKVNEAIVEVTALTADSYKYLYSTAMAEEKNDDPLSEKVVVFNNIKNGYGIVGGMLQQLYSVKP
ncbi:DUF4249 domain-containing protein [Chitinophaga qingshengii]|uniref:DUF4249 domain-containing protein n=1 Tax=Chitinophaga qingshengii TaxID=1569794 RepID=A0ABR7TWU0_9BACT|nr:DUF4249 domain-containing protein [Chitinophaga qingshengii]MBC9934939.1 DUF4249 domain-containing protein [Chitinophaga qingshengii]